MGLQGKAVEADKATIVAGKKMQVEPAAYRDCQMYIYRTG
jgi:hypothetical protein